METWAAWFLTWSGRRHRRGDEGPATYFLLGPDFLISVQDSEGHYEEVVDRLRTRVHV